MLFGEYQLAEAFGVLRPEWLSQVMSGHDMARWVAYYRYKNVLEKHGIAKARAAAEAEAALNKGAR